MVGSRTQFHSLARQFGNADNGSMPAYEPIGEINARMNPQTFVKYQKTTALGEETGLGSILGNSSLPAGVLVSSALVWFGLDFYGSKPVINFTKSWIEQPYKYTQNFLLGVGTIGLAYYAFQNPSSGGL